MNKDVMRMNNEAGCTWPNCKCPVPTYAWSMHNRVNFCLKLRDYDKQFEIEMKHREV